MRIPSLPPEVLRMLSEASRDSKKLLEAYPCRVHPEVLRGLSERRLLREPCPTVRDLLARQGQGVPS